jgi:uncharacterized protein
MKQLLLGCIKLYWRIPIQYRRSCIFKESCSNYVHRITIEQGFLKGTKALKQRRQQCRSGYSFFSTNNEKMVLLKDKTIIKRQDTVV